MPCLVGLLVQWGTRGGTRAASLEKLIPTHGAVLRLPHANDGSTQLPLSGINPCLTPGDQKRGGYRQIPHATEYRILERQSGDPATERERGRVDAPLPRLPYVPVAVALLEDGKSGPFWSTCLYGVQRVSTTMAMAYCQRTASAHAATGVLNPTRTTRRAPSLRARRYVTR